MASSQTGLTALIIEDNEFVRTALRTVLLQAGIVVLGEARDGESGLAKAQLLRPHLVCLDVGLPDINGLEVLQRIKTMLPSCRVVIITGNAQKELITELLQQGADGLVLKPFTLARITSALEYAFRKPAVEKKGA